MEETKPCKTCQTCKHFVRHYIRNGKNYSPIREGHCVHPRVKSRETTTPACKHFVKNR